MRLIRDGEKGGKGLWRWGKREIIYLSLHCHYQNDFCIKVGCDGSHFNVSSALRWAAMGAILKFHNCEGQSHKTVSTDHNF